ncbi:MAG: glycosyltransferase family A protein, partial [Geminicoccaceae bacterium]|nr:glycosyltransferase family A protein [Geminicoccaceae bacterium]
MPSPPDPDTVSVVVPSYRRVADRARCLDALERQSHRPFEVIVVLREDDLETGALLDRRPEGRLALRRAHPPRGGVVAAYNTGLDVTRGAIVAITDDDAAPHPDWLARIVRRFRDDPALGGLGGRDVLHVRGEPVTGNHPRVGEVQWFGRTFGN